MEHFYRLRYDKFSLWGYLGITMRIDDGCYHEAVVRPIDYSLKNYYKPFTLDQLKCLGLCSVVYTLHFKNAGIIFSCKRASCSRFIRVNYVLALGLKLKMV